MKTYEQCFLVAPFVFQFFPGVDFKTFVVWTSLEAKSLKPRKFLYTDIIRRLELAYSHPEILEINVFCTDIMNIYQTETYVLHFGKTTQSTYPSWRA